MRRLSRACAVVLAGVLVAGCAGGSTSGGSATVEPMPTAAAVPVTASPSPTPTSAPSGPPTIESAGAIRIDVRPAPDWLTVVDGNVWTATRTGIVRLDPATGSTGTVVELRGVCLGFDGGYESLWAGGCFDSEIWRIEPATGEVLAKIVLPAPIEEEGSVAAGEGGVWIVSTTNQLMKVDPASNKVAGSWDLPVGAAAVRAGLGSLWVTVSESNQLLRIDPTDPDRQVAIAVGGFPRFLAIGEGAVWVMNQDDGSISRVSATGEVLGTTTIATRIRGGDIAVGGGSVWVQPGLELLVQLDPSDGRMLAEYGPPSGSGSVAADDDAVWVSAHDVDSVWRLPLR